MPAQPPIYAIGDIHGQAALLADALARIEADGGVDARVIVLGDLVDRGPESRFVIEMLRLGIAEGRNWTVLRGNHDQMFLDFLAEGAEDDPAAHVWIAPRMGGLATLASYGVPGGDAVDPVEMVQAARAAIPEDHRAFLAACPLTHVAGPLLFVHAGIRPGVPLAAQDPEDLIWIRDDFLHHAEPFDWLVVHGHTPVDEACHYGNRVNLDTGAGYGRHLSVGVFEQGAVYRLEAEGRLPLMPRSDGPRS